MRISILDLQGREVMKLNETNNLTAGQTYTLNLDGISGGVYVVSLQDGDKVYSQKIIVSR